MIQSDISDPRFFKKSHQASGAFLRILVSGILVLIAAVTPVAAQIHRLSTDEATLFKRISASSGQRREAVKLDPILCIVARKRATDMANRNYFSHTNPDGQGANYLVLRASYTLPSYYDRSRSGNNIESIGMSTGTPQEIVSLWLKSSGHRVHVLGETDFYQQQNSFGVGVFRSPVAPHYKYFVFLSAPPNATLSPRAATLVSPTGATLASTRPLATSWAGITGTANP